MKFSSQEHLDTLLNDFKAKAESLTKDKKKPVTFEYTLDGDDVYVAYIRTPSLIPSIRAFDFLSAGKAFEAGFQLFENVFIAEESDKMFDEDEAMKIGLCGKIGLLLKAKYPEAKKN